MVDYDKILEESEKFVRTYFAQKLQPQYVFHDLEHTVQTVAASKVIGEGYQLDKRDMALLLIATWFHDTGYAQGPGGHEERSCAYAEEFLSGKLPEQDLSVITGCIRSTKVPQAPVTLLEQVICDADLSHLGMKTYWDRNSKLRHEFNLTRDLVMTEHEWLEFELNFMLAHDYHTAVAKEYFNKRKAKHIQQLLKQRKRLNPEKAANVEELAVMGDQDKNSDLNRLLQESEAELKLSRFGRGVETMYRTTYRTHTNLSQMADSKANIMLSVNAIVIGIIASNLMPKLIEKGNDYLIVPSVLLTVTCLGSMVYATLSTKPKVTEGVVTREAIQQRKANLLFFGNFHNMALDEFQWGVNEMLKDPDFLYSSMSRDLYFLGIVLAQKYRYLSICYNIFMWGLIVSVLSFGIALAFAYV